MSRITKADVFEFATEAAEKLRRPGESIYEARARYWATPEGRRARKRMDEAPGLAVIELQELGKADSPITPAYQKLREIGDEIRSERPELSREEATVEAFKRRPDLLRRYQSERNEFIAKTLGR